MIDLDETVVQTLKIVKVREDKQLIIFSLLATICVYFFEFLYDSLDVEIVSLHFTKNFYDFTQCLIVDCDYLYLRNETFFLFLFDSINTLKYWIVEETIIEAKVLM